MTTTARWLTGAAALLGVCLVVALGLAVRPAPTADLTGAQPSAQKHVDGATETQLTELRVRAAGCDAYLTKPIDVTRFAGQVRECWREARARA